MPPVRASTRAYLRKFLWLGEAAKGRRVTKAEATFDEDTTKGNDHEALEGPMTRGILKKAQHSDEDTTKDKDHEALEGPMTRGILKRAQHSDEDTTKGKDHKSLEGPMTRGAGECGSGGNEYHQLDGAQRGNRGNNGGNDRPRQNRVEGVKLNVPPFKGKSDPDAYLDWEMKIEHVFAYNDYTEEQKIKLAIAKFSDYALVWWHKNQREMQRKGGREVGTWTEMKRVMRKRYVPTSYNRTMRQKLQRLSQGNLTVEEYYKEMEMALVRANIEEESEDIMARFLNGLNPEIRDVVELQEYVELDELLHKALRDEQQIKRKSAVRRNSPNTYNQNWANRSKKEGGNSSSPAATSPRGKSAASNVGGSKHNTSTSSSDTGTRNIKCFKCLGRGRIASECPTRRTMIMKANGEVTSESEISEEEVEEEEYEEEAMQGDMLMVRRLLGNQMLPLDDNQRENIFHTKCVINGKLCSLIVDGGNCTNVASSRLVTKLNLETKPHPRPYKLQWLSEDEEIKVTQQVEVCLTIGRYNDRVWCDVVPMDATHVLLGRPWQYDTKAVYDGFINKISFKQDDKKIVLKPLSPREEHPCPIGQLIGATHKKLRRSKGKCSNS
eukprot:XP_025983911.1 uncharacterized protein LOC113001425 [Glycine max]